MRRLIGLLGFVLAVSACGSDRAGAPEPAATSSSIAEVSLVGLDMPDHMLTDAGLTPVRTMTTACALLFDGHDFPALAVEMPTSETEPDLANIFQQVMMSVAFSGPDALVDHVGA